MKKLNVPELTVNNYFKQTLNIKADLSFKRLQSAIFEVKAAGLCENGSKI